MIDPKELRLGNMVNVQLNYDEVSYDECEVEQITDKYLHHTLPTGGGTNTEWEKVEPIPITVEWLERCGFVRDRAGWHLPETQFSLTDKLYPCWLDRMLWPQDIPDFKHLSLQYIHQLMNLYYSLTGEELTIKEKV